MRERTPFGARLHAARTHAKLSQTDLARKVGLAQSTLAELEWDLDGSSASVRLAVACGVRPEWLAEGLGEMLDTFRWPFPHVARERVLDLEPQDLGYVEGKLAAALDDLTPREPTLEELALAKAANARNVKPAQRRRRA